jgi:ABC-2 type transport system ATP-binding protein
VLQAARTLAPVEVPQLTSTSVPAAIVAADLRVVRGGTEVLHGLQFEVAPGEVVGLLGPSGSGKSTLIRALVGAQRRVTGRCEILGRPAGHRDLRRLVAYVTQAPAVYEGLTARENLRYFASVIGAPPSAVQRVLDEVGLRDDADRLVRSLSGGQSRRVSLGIARLGSPQVLVLDEPTVGLDPLLRRDLWRLLHGLADDGVTLVVSSHVMEEAAECDRLLLLRGGRLIADDSEASLLTRTGAGSVGEAFLQLVEAAAP